MQEVPIIKTAAFHSDTSDTDWKESLTRLSMITEDGVRVDFDLDVMALSLLGITFSPVLGELKARATAQGESFH